MVKFSISQFMFANDKSTFKIWTPQSNLLIDFGLAGS